MVVRWAYEDGGRGAGSPLPPAIASELLLEYARRYPDRVYSVEEAAVEADDRQTCGGGQCK